MQAGEINEKQTESRNMPFQEIRQYRRWVAATRGGNDAHAAADGRTPNNRCMAGAAAAARTDTPSKLAATETKGTTSMIPKTPSRDERRDPIPVERQDMAIGDREGVECTTIGDCVVDEFILHEIRSTPTYSSILKKGGSGGARLCASGCRAE